MNIAAPPINPGPAELDAIRGLVAIVGIGEAAVSGQSGRNSVDMSFAAIDAALADCGLAPCDVDGLMVTGGLPGQINAAAFRDHYQCVQEIWESGEGGAFSRLATAPHTAWQAIRAGRAKTIVSVVGIDWASQKKAGSGGPADFHREHAIKANAEAVFGFIPQPVYFAHIAQQHMARFGTQPEQLGAIAVSSRRHAQGHPEAVMRNRPLDLEAYLASEPFVGTLRMEDCCLISDGAAAVVMTSADRARDMRKPPILVEGVGLGGALERTYFAMEPEFTSTPQRFAAPGAFAMAGIEPSAIDVCAVYDPFTITALMQIEDIGFCPKGEGGPFVEGNRLSHILGRAQGGLPFNTHGGLLSHAYTLGGSHLVELVRQLRGEAANQVHDAELALFGGYSGSEAGCMILRKDRR